MVQSHHGLKAKDVFVVATRDFLGLPNQVLPLFMPAVPFKLIFISFSGNDVTIV